MKRFIGAFLITAYLMVAVSVAGTPVKPKDVTTTVGNYTEGRILLRELDFDFGYVPQGGIISHSFWLLNVGTDTLEIIKIKAG